MVNNLSNFLDRVEHTNSFQTETFTLPNWDFHGWQGGVIVMERGGFGLLSLTTTAGNITVTGNLSKKYLYIFLNPSLTSSRRASETKMFEF